MKTIDRLILRACKQYGLTGKEIYLAFIDMLDNGKWQATADIWSGQQGSGERFTETAETLEDARLFIEGIAEKYPPRKDLTIIINDLPRED